jgi:hypothetical protein
LHLACLRRIRQAQEAGEIDEARAFLLVIMVATYPPLREEERQALQVQLSQEGAVLAMREDIRRVVRARFGSVPPALETALQAMTQEEELGTLFDRTLSAQTVDELATIGKKGTSGPKGCQRNRSYSIEAR